jgi:DNA-binding IclR family transcriptional regulator
MVDRHSQSHTNPSAVDSRAVASPKTMVAPFARALALLNAFTPKDRWLGNGELARRTDLPASTVSRLTQSLVTLGYLLHAPAERKFRLATSVLALGYAAYANSEVQQLARKQMREFAAAQCANVILSSRYRLELIVLESCNNPKSVLSLNLHIGARVGLASSPMGWALLASLPETERYYLLSNVERRMPREWPRLRRRCSEAIGQVLNKGYCNSPSDWDPNLGVVAVPVLITGQEPRVLAGVAPISQFQRARVEREIGPRLLAMARDLQQSGEAQ